MGDQLSPSAQQLSDLSFYLFRPLYYPVPTRNNASFAARLNGFDEKPANGQQSKVDYYGQQQQKQEGRVIPIQIKADEKHLGFYNSPHKRDYSAEPIGGKRFSSTLNLNSRLSSASSANPSEHRYSSSISSGLPRRQSFSFRNERTPERPLPALPNGVPFSQLAHDGERQRSLSMAEPEEPPQFDKLMERFSNISTNNHRPRLPSASMYQFPTKTGTTNATTKFASSTLPPVPSAPRPATSDVTMPREKSAADRELLKRQPSSSDGVPCLKGLMNHGNTCYFSAIIQCLACCEKFAEYFICSGPDEAAMKSNSADQSAAHMPLLANALSATLRCLWFNHSSADSSCYQLLQRISKANPQFIISQQQDAHECLIWLLDRLHEEIMERETRGNNHINNDEATIVHRMQKSEGELASDALERVSGTNRSTVMDLFRAQFRSAMECTNPVCGFTNLTFDPYSSISLSVPLPKRPSELSVLFIPFFGARQIIRYHFQLADPLYTIWDVKERVMQHVRALSEQ
uniref:ubiquitinyl hydrolase 1 n=1 Tax=Globodera pallida TaxID=36090 RepID=A0A183CM78_GLOPA